jgi:hypothetical protein
VTVPAGNYSGPSLKSSLRSSRARPLDLALLHFERRPYGGRRVDDTLELGWRPSARFECSADATLTRFALPGASFRLLTGSFACRFALDPRRSLALLVQHDSFSREIGIDVRARAEFEPGRELKIIVGHGLDSRGDELRTTTNRITLKLAWSLRF